MAFVSDIQYLTFKLRESLLQIQNDPSHDIASVRFCKNPQSSYKWAAPSETAKKSELAPILKVKDVGLRENLYKATEPLLQTLQLRGSNRYGSKTKSLEIFQSTSANKLRRKSDPNYGSNSVISIDLANNGSSNRPFNDQLSASLGKTGIQLKAAGSFTEAIKSKSIGMAKDEVDNSLILDKNTLQDDDILEDLGDELVYEIPPGFVDIAPSFESQGSSLGGKRLKTSNKRKITPRPESNSNLDADAKPESDPSNFGLASQEPILLELKRFLEGDDDGGQAKRNGAADAVKDKDKELVDIQGFSKHNSVEELNSAIHIPVNEYKFDKVPIEHDFQTKLKQKSFLTALVERKAELNNPLAAQYSSYGSKSDPNGMKIKMFLPFSENPGKPLCISVKADTSVDNVIGYCLYEYIDEKLLPNLGNSMLNVAFWSIRIVEDDGEIDEDFPALERSRKIGKYAFDQFALMNLKPIQEIITTVRSKANIAEIPETSSPVSPSVFLKVHLYSTLEIKQTTIIKMPLDITMQEVFNRICAKTGYDPKNFILKMVDVKTDVPLDKTLQQIDCIEFCVLKRSSGGAGDIFLRPQDEVESKEDKIDFSAEDYLTMFKQYSVVSNKLMGRQERLLTIDGEYVHLDGAESKGFFDRGKSAASYHMKDVISCVQPKAASGIFRLSIQRADGNKIYEFEAATPRIALELCSRFAYIIEMRSKA